MSFNLSRYSDFTRPIDYGSAGNVSEHRNVTAADSRDSDSTLAAFEACQAIVSAQTVLIPLLHGTVSVTGLAANLYALTVLLGKRTCLHIEPFARIRSCGGPRNPRRTGSDSHSLRGGKAVPMSHYNHFLCHILLCNMCMLCTFPMWVTQTVYSRGWVFGYVGCKVIKSLMTFSLQYGITTLMYVNAERFMKVVYNRKLLSCCRTKAFTQRTVATLTCACLPILFSCFDLYSYSLVKQPHGLAEMCASTASRGVSQAVLWSRTTICFIVPCIVLAICNGAVVRTVKKHVRTVSSLGLASRSLKGAQVIPLLTIVCFVCCWIPWSVTSVYYLQVHDRCHAKMLMVMNATLAAGNVHCIITPTMNLCVMPKARRGCAGAART